MSERKVLNKYYPPDFDPAKIPRVKMPKNRQYTVRLMAPFNMKCLICGEYIYKGKKFNAQKEDVESDTYLGVRIYRFYIKCPRCLGEIAFKTNPEKADYEIEAGATRNFMALKLAVEQAEREEREVREQEASNPMTVLEKRTEQSKNEIDCLENLERLKDLNRRHRNIDYDAMLDQYSDQMSEQQFEQAVKNYVKTIKFGSNSIADVKTTNTSNHNIVSEKILEVRDLATEEPFVATTTPSMNVLNSRKRNSVNAGFSDISKRLNDQFDIFKSIKIRKKTENADKIVTAPTTSKAEEPKSGLKLLASYSSDSASDNEDNEDNKSLVNT